MTTASSSAKAKQSRPSTPLCEEVDCASEQSSSPFVESPEHFPLHYSHQHDSSSKVQNSGHHHYRKVEVRGGGDHGEHERENWGYDGDEGFEEDGYEEDEDVPPAVPPKDDVKGEFYSQPKLIKSASDMELEAQLLPIDDPLLADDVFFDAKDNIRQAISSTTTAEDDDEEGWETESSTRYSDDSFNSSAYDDSDNDDDTRTKLAATSATDSATHDYDDHRFIDSGWGGECLRETEDIDFEFVYALHTFVATVEGQANAQKGDTMVLLDDSNSYWWLVRVVKDSTIGGLIDDVWHEVGTLC